MPWLRVFAEGVVIVASVLLALAADAWWDGRQERQEEIAILRGLRADFASTLEVIEESRNASDRVVAAAVKLMTLTGPATPAVSSATVDTLLVRALAGSPFEPVDATLAAVLSAGDLGMIGNVDIRGALTKWRPHIERIRRIREQAGGSLLDHFVPYLSERIPMQALDAIGSPDSSLHPPSGFQHDSRVLLADLRFENGLSDTLLYHRLLVSLLDDFEGYVTATLAFLDLELGQTADEAS